MIGTSASGKEPRLRNIFPQFSNLIDFLDWLLWFPLLIMSALFGRPRGISRMILVKFRCIYTAGTLGIWRKLWHCEASFITCVGVCSGFPCIHVVLWEALYYTAWIPQIWTLFTLYFTREQVHLSHFSLTWYPLKWSYIYPAKNHNF